MWSYVVVACSGALAGALLGLIVCLWCARDAATEDEAARARFFADHRDDGV